MSEALRTWRPDSSLPERELNVAIFHCDVRPLGRSGGQSAVAAVAYRTASRLLDEHNAKVYDFTGKKGVEHCEIVLPDGVKANWAYDRPTLWNAAERAEKRKDARVAREVGVALPCELSLERQVALARAFAQDLANRFGAAVDVAIHRPTGLSDSRNVHAHVLMTTRQVGADGLGEKTLLERSNTWLLNNGQPTSVMQLRDIRQAWENHVNRHLMEAGLDIRVDHRSHSERGLEIQPTRHVGVHATQLSRRGLCMPRARIGRGAASRNAALIREKPEQVLALITAEKSVFDRHDVARALDRYIVDAQAFHDAFSAVMASPLLLEVQPGQNGALARYSTKEMVELEYTLVFRALQMRDTLSHAVGVENIAAALAKQDAAIRAGVDASLQRDAVNGQISASEGSRRVAAAGLSEEQRVAVEHITGPEQIAAVIGFAGAGKSTMLAAARDSWESQGFRVHGAALAGKAAEGLTESSGIASRTLASWEYGWAQNRGELSRYDIFVIDEAGMLSSRQLARFVGEVRAKGAKLVLVGDYEQLQAIGAGSPFRAIVDEVGAVALSEIRRQKEGWQREASVAFATHCTAKGLASFADRGDICFLSDRDAARGALIADYLDDLDQRPSNSRIALAHRRSDVHAINSDIRAALQAKGDLAQGDEKSVRLGSERVYQARDGARSFAPGDRIILLENNRELGVKNGMLGTVLVAESNEIQARVDGVGRNMTRVVTIPVERYQAFDHGYATTIHKAQGATVDRAFVMASSTMDRHLTYVSMTRHRDRARLYVGREEMKDLNALIASLGRSGAKESTLDYLNMFGRRRGLAEVDGISTGPSIGTRWQDDCRPNARSGKEERRRILGDCHSSGSSEKTAGLPESGVERIVPLVPALTEYSRDPDTIAREKATPDLERRMEVVRSLCRNVYADPDGVTMKLGDAIRDQTTDGAGLARTIGERPELFGELRGKSGLFGDNSERKGARSMAEGLASHVASAAETWTRRLNAERSSEIWQREKRDRIEVPGLTARSEKILKELDAVPQAEKKRFLETMAGTSEGREALIEARRIAVALEKRFGRSSPLSNLSGESMRLGREVVASLDRIKEVARIVDKAERAELSRQYEVKRGLGKTLGLGL